MSRFKLKKNKGIPKKPIEKYKMLVWSDAAVATTGFGTVAKHIMKALYNTGRYEIDQLGINYFGDFYDRNEYPYSISPAKLANPSDPYGNQMLLNALGQKEYDVLFVINDTFVTNAISGNVKKLQQLRQARGQKVFKIVYYYPVDCRFHVSAAGMFNIADRKVAYTYFAKAMTELAGLSPTDVIYHGADTTVYRPLSDADRRIHRAQHFKIMSDDTFLWINVNRNSSRKDIARTILAFSEFKKGVPDSKLYLHTVMNDTSLGHNIDLNVAVAELGLDPGKDIISPKNYSAAKGYPAENLNLLYNCANGYLTTNLGEGWGLTITEAMAAGVPVVAGDHTTAPEILGAGRGYIYECKEKIYIDNQGYRYWGRMEDILDKMLECYGDWILDKQDPNMSKRKDIIKNARLFTHKYSWQNVCKQWVKLFDEVLQPSEEKILIPQAEVL